MNMMLGRRVYSQIIFSQFDPEVSSNNCNISDYIINKKREFGGHTRTGSPVCTIKTYKLFEGLIQGWGMEDVDLHQKFVNHKDIDVFRAADPGVLHVYHQIKCDPELPSQRLTQCKNSRASIIANQKLLLRNIMATQQKDPRFHYKL